LKAVLLGEIGGGGKRRNPEGRRVGEGGEEEEGVL